MKLLKTVLLLALHGGAHASLRHKATKNAVDAETTQSLAVEAATATFIKMPGAVAKVATHAGSKPRRKRARRCPSPILLAHATPGRRGASFDRSSPPGGGRKARVHNVMNYEAPAPGSH